MKRCPDCAEGVQDAAKVCRYCGYRFDGRGWQNPMTEWQMFGLLLTIVCIAAAAALYLGGID